MFFGCLTNFWENSETVFLNFTIFFAVCVFFLSLECKIYLCCTYSTLFVAFSSLNLFLIVFLCGYSLLSLVVALPRLLNFYFPTFLFFSSSNITWVCPCVCMQVNMRSTVYVCIQVCVSVHSVSKYKMTDRWITAKSKKRKEKKSQAKGNNMHPLALIPIIPSFFLFYSILAHLLINLPPHLHPFPRPSSPPVLRSSSPVQDEAPEEIHHKPSSLSLHEN